ncbi:MAG: 5-formyltetrahydrofolate cyclo-ligase [Nitrospirota bacterium]
MKKTIRREILKRRDEISPEIKAGKDSLIKQRLFSLPEFIAVKTVFFYASFRSEVETLSMIKESLKMGKRVVLPKVQRKGNMIKLYEIADINELSPGYMGIPEPFFSNSRFLSLDELDLIVIPGVAFDYSGNRLGYGGGYYDMLLAQRQKEMPIIALAYEEQLVDSIPVEEHDVKVDVIVTDKRIIRIK